MKTRTTHPEKPSGMTFEQFQYWYRSPYPKPKQYKGVTWI